MDQKLTHIYEKKWRRINPYICDKCGKPRYSFIFTRAKEKICRSCARNIVPENQQSLFPVADDLKQFSGSMATNVKTCLDEETENSSLTPREAAKELIRRDVSRKDSSRNMTYESTAAGRYKGHVIAGGKIIINEIDGKKLDPAEMFSFKELYHEVVGEHVVERGKNKKDIAPRMTAEEAAKDLIRNEVMRGDSCSAIQATWMGSSNGRYSATIISGGKIRVDQIGRKELKPPVTFSLKKIYHEIVMEKKQHEKCGCDRKKIVAALNKQALGRGDYETKEILDIAFPKKKKK